MKNLFLIKSFKKISRFSKIAILKLKIKISKLAFFPKLLVFVFSGVAILVLLIFFLILKQNQNIPKDILPTTPTATPTITYPTKSITKNLETTPEKPYYENFKINKNGEFEINIKDLVKKIIKAPTGKFVDINYRIDCGGFTGGLSLLTDNGEGYYYFDDESLTSEPQKINTQQKIKKLVYTGNPWPSSCSSGLLYYLTESDQLIDKEGKTYEENSPNYIHYDGGLGGGLALYQDGSLRYFNSDREEGVLDEKKIKDEKVTLYDEVGNKIIASKHFSSGVNSIEKYYIFDINDYLYVFSPLEFSNFDKYIVKKFKESKVKDIVPMTEGSNGYYKTPVVINFIDGSTEKVTIDYGYYYELRNNDDPIIPPTNSKEYLYTRYVYPQVAISKDSLIFPIYGECKLVNKNSIDATKFNGTNIIRYPLGIFLLENKIGYKSLEEFKKDFALSCSSEYFEAAPLMLNDKWLVFSDSCSKTESFNAGRLEGGAIGGELVCKDLSSTVKLK